MSPGLPVVRRSLGAVRSADTSPEAHARHLAVYRSMSPARRGEIAAAMSDEVTLVAAEGIRRRHADYDDEQVRWALRRLRHGDDRFRAVWPDGPLLDP